MFHVNQLVEVHLMAPTKQHRSWMRSRSTPPDFKVRFYEISTFEWLNLFRKYYFVRLHHRGIYFYTKLKLFRNQKFESQNFSAIIIWSDGFFMCSRQKKINITFPSKQRHVLFSLLGVCIKSNSSYENVYWPIESFLSFFLSKLNGI